MKLSPTDHYNIDPIGTCAGIPGAGILAYITGDHLHPPMVDDSSVWSNAERWPEGAVQHTIDALRLCQLRPGQSVLDVGCGVGGPARTVADTYGVSVTGINISRLQVETSQLISKRKQEWLENTSFLLHDCIVPMPATYRFDCIYSINMLYHIENKRRLLSTLGECLHRNGVLLVDDWMLTTEASEAERTALGRHFISPYFTVDNDFLNDAGSIGFDVVDSEDLSIVAQRHMSQHFRREFLKCCAPKLRIFKHGKLMAQQFLEAVELTIRLYVSGRMTYRRFLLKRRNQDD